MCEGIFPLLLLGEEGLNVVAKFSETIPGAGPCFHDAHQREEDSSQVPFSTPSKAERIWNFCFLLRKPRLRTDLFS